MSAPGNYTSLVATSELVAFKGAAVGLEDPDSAEPTKGGAALSGTFTASAIAGATFAILLLVGAFVAGVSVANSLLVQGPTPTPVLRHAALKLRDMRPMEGPGRDAPFVKRRLTFVTTQTKGDPLLAQVGKFEVLNLGEGRNWTDYRTKVELLGEYLRSRLALVGYAAPGEVDEDLVAFVDGSDAFWGGCELFEFQKAYSQIVAMSGAPIVFGAEVVCGEQDCNRVPPVPSWADDLSGGHPLSGEFWANYAVGCQGTWTAECSAKRDCGYWAPCARPPSVKFLNSGFIMGPVRELNEMVVWALRNYKRWSVWGDQSVFAQYWLEHPHRATLDYTSRLALSLSDMGEELLDVDVKGGRVRNLALDSTQCLIHGNGRGRKFLGHLLTRLGHGDLGRAYGGHESSELTHDQ